MYVESSSINTEFDEYAHYVTAGIDPNMYGIPDDVDSNGNPCVNMYFTRHMCKVIVDEHVQRRMGGLASTDRRQ